METWRKEPRDGHQVRLYLHPSSEDLAESPDQILDKHDPEQMALWVSASFPAWAANGGQWPRSFWQKIQEMEKELEKLESLLSKENLYNYDKKTFDDTINQIGEIKKKLSFAEERWLEIQILSDEINKQWSLNNYMLTKNLNFLKSS